MSEKNGDKLNDFHGDEERIGLLSFKKKEEENSKDYLIKVFDNLERDLIIKHNCPKEFNLENNNNDKDFKKFEVFGNPICYICTSSYNDDSSIQLFFCSHCKKLFCRRCLSLHYNSDFKDIESSYIKYKVNNNEELINKKIPNKLKGCKLWIFLFLLLCLNMFYLFLIFEIKPILSCLETVLINCVKEIFTHRIEDPNSLFNFYGIFFERITVLNFDFNLIMIMNWLGDRLLFSCGFIVTIIIFLGINSLFFILLYNFDFLDYNENNKYGIWKFLHLLLIYIIFFIGLGGSSLLSQRIFIELFNKFQENIIENKKEKNKIYEKYFQELKKTDNDEIILEEKKDEIIKEEDNDEIILEDKNDELIQEENNEGRKTFRETIVERAEKLNKNSRFKSFYAISIITIFSFTFGSITNLSIKAFKMENDEIIKNETYEKYNGTFLYEELNNTNITKIIIDKIYDNDRNLFFRQYLVSYAETMVISILLYWIMLHCFFNSDEKKGKKINSDILENNDNKNKDSAQENINGKKENEDNTNLDSIIKLKEDKNRINHTICKCCGFFYFSSTLNLKGDNPLYKTIFYCLKDFFLLMCKSLIDCCDKTFCNIINIIFCGEKDIVRCNCDCCGCDRIKYDKKSENFCFCYKEKRKYKWFHDYITSPVQKDIAPYVLEYYLLGLIVIALDIKFTNFQINTPKIIKTFDDYSFSDLWENAYDTKEWTIILLTFIVFIIFSSVYGGSKKKQKEDNIEIYGYIQTFSILNGIHIMLFINSIVSLIFSILYLKGITDFDDYIIIPILITQFFYFSLNFYCLCISEQQNDNEFILSGSILVTIYINVWNFIYSFIEDYIKDEEYSLFLFQLVLSSIIIVIFLYYLICSKSRFKYIICNNCMNCNLCGCFQSCCSCCIYNIYCEDGTQYCDCCCCDEECKCCYCQKCNSCNSYVCCNKLSEE